MGLTQWLAYSQGGSGTRTALAPGVKVCLDISLERLTGFRDMLHEGANCLVKLEATGNGLTSLAGATTHSLVLEVNVTFVCVKKCNCCHSAALPLPLLHSLTSVTCAD